MLSLTSKPLCVLSENTGLVYKWWHNETFDFQEKPKLWKKNVIFLKNWSNQMTLTCVCTHTNHCSEDGDLPQGRRMARSSPPYIWCLFTITSFVPRLNFSSDQLRQPTAPPQTPWWSTSNSSVRVEPIVQTNTSCDLLMSRPPFCNLTQPLLRLTCILILPAICCQFSRYTKLKHIRVPQRC